MPHVHFLAGREIAQRALRFDAPTRIGADGALLASDAVPFAASIVAFSATPARFAVVAAPGAGVLLGARRVTGAAPLADRDLLRVARREFRIGLDALPTPLTSGDPRCPACLRDDVPRAACPRCGAVACDECWAGFRGGRCASTGCEQPAQHERALWAPAPEDFLDADTAPET